MDLLNNLKLSHRLWIAFGIVTALTMILGFASYRALNDLDTEVSNLAQQNMAELEHAARLGDIASRHRIQSFTLIVPSSESAKQAARDEQAARVAEFDETWQKLIATPASDETQALRDQVDANWKEFKEAAEMIDQLVGMELIEDATDMTIGDGNALYAKLTKSIDDMVAATVRSAENAGTAAHDTYAAASKTIVMVLIISIGICVLAAVVVSRSVSSGVREAVRLLGEIANGKLDGRVDVSRRDEIGELNAGMAKMQNTLKAFVDAEIEMANQHEVGMLDHRINADDFHGAYADMAHALNDLVAGRIDTM